MENLKLKNMVKIIKNSLFGTVYENFKGRVKAFKKKFIYEPNMMV